MDEQRERVVARNEALFRDANEAIARGLWPEQGGDVIKFRCECAADCGQTVELTPRAYEQMRRDPRRFAVRDGHQLPDVEDVVERHNTYLIVEKRGAGGQVAEDLDPRS